jgi:hypothetical protein
MIEITLKHCPKAKLRLDGLTTSILGKELAGLDDYAVRDAMICTT